MLDHAVEHPITLVAAGPGAGKTVLLTDWSRRRPVTPVWVSVDSRDNNPERFGAALRRAFDEAGADSARWLDPLADLGIDGGDEGGADELPVAAVPTGR